MPIHKQMSTDAPASARPHKRTWLVLLTSSTPVFCCIGCLLAYLVTSPCNLAAQWHGLLGTVPTVPLPADVQLLSAQASAGKPIFGNANADDDYYSELYSTLLTQDTIVAFYEARGATCSQEEQGTTYWSCTLDAMPIGWGEIAILSPAAYHTKPMPGARGDIPSDHLNQSVPATGTLLRTYVQWCVDR
jgi:hypothetical protein